MFAGVRPSACVRSFACVRLSELAPPGDNRNRIHRRFIAEK
jgi:hypothetical protein